MAHLVCGVGIALFGDLDLDAPKGRIAYLAVCVIANDILGAQLITDLAESGVEFAGTFGVVVFAASVFGDLDQRVFAAEVASGISRYRHHDDAVHDGFSLLGAAQSTLVVGLAGGIAAVG